MKKDIITLLIILVIVITFVDLKADENIKKYRLGSYSAIMSGTMKLSKLDSDFSDLSSDGIDGPHFSGLYFTYSYDEYFRIGFATLTANSNAKKKISYDIQAAGLLLEANYGNEFFITSGLHFGPMIVDVLQRDSDSNDSQVENGKFYKSGGLFFAPYLTVGYKYKSYEFGLIAKPLFTGMPENENDDNSVFTATYYGINLSYNF